MGSGPENNSEIRRGSKELVVPTEQRLGMSSHADNWATIKAFNCVKTVKSNVPPPQFLNGILCPPKNTLEILLLVLKNYLLG